MYSIKLHHSTVPDTNVKHPLVMFFRVEKFIQHQLNNESNKIMLYYIGNILCPLEERLWPTDSLYHLVWGQQWQHALEKHFTL